MLKHTRRGFPVALAALVTLCACSAPAPAARPSSVVSGEGCGGNPPATVDAQREQELFELVNERRRQHRLPALRLSRALADAARLHARDMSEDGYLDHDSFDRSESRLVRTCEWSERVRKLAPGGTHIAENIAAGTAIPGEVVQGWMDSPVHRDNLLGASLTEIGIGYWAGGERGVYWVADFAGD